MQGDEKMWVLIVLMIGVVLLGCFGLAAYESLQEKKAFAEHGYVQRIIPGTQSTYWTKADQP